MNKKLLFPLALVPLAATRLQAQKSAQTQRVDKRPNIILFMVDDMDGKTLHSPSGHKRQITISCTKHPTWNDLPNKA